MGGMAQRGLRHIKEVKRKLNGVVATYDVELLGESARRGVLARWVAPQGNIYGLEPGSVSLGVWPLHQGACWGAYRLHGPCGRLLSYRFDALEHPSFDGSRVCYSDLVLDAVVRPGDGGSWQLEVQDEDELEEARTSQAITLSQLAQVARFREELTDVRRLLAQVDELVAELSPEACRAREV